MWRKTSPLLSFFKNIFSQLLLFCTQKNNSSFSYKINCYNSRLDKKYNVGIILTSCTYKWLNSPNTTPNVMWVTPKITDIFILNEFKKVRRLLAKFHIWRRKHQFSIEEHHNSRNKPVSFFYRGLEFYLKWRSQQKFVFCKNSSIFDLSEEKVLLNRECKQKCIFFLVRFILLIHIPKSNGQTLITTSG